MRILLTRVAAAILAVLASVGVYQASQPVSKQATTPIIQYGTR